MSRSTADPTNPFYAPPGTPDGRDDAGPESTLFGWLARHLRGRILLTALALPLFAGVGGIIGHRFIVPTFRSTAVLQFAPEASPILYGSREDRAIPMFDAFLEAQLVAIRHPDVVQDALRTAEWSDFAGRAGLDEAAFRDALTAERTKRTQTIDVVFEHENPDTARAGVRAAVAAYVASFRNAYAGETETQIAVLTAYLEDILNRQAALEAHEMSLTNAYEAAGLAQMHEARLAEINDLQAQLRGVEQQRAVAERQVESQAQRAREVTPSGSDAQLAARDTAYAGLLAELQTRQREADRVRARTGDRHLQVVRLDRELASLRERLDARAAHLERHPEYAATEATTGVADLIARLDNLGSLHKTLRTQIDQAQTEAVELGGRRVEIRQIEADLLATNQLIKDTQFKLEAQKLEAHRTSPLTVLTDGDTPNRIHMGRKQAQAAVMGAALGGGTGLGLLLLWSMLDRRLHGFRDVRDRFPRQPVLALVPTLQGDLSDPDESLVAAMAIHEIRAKLQRTFQDSNDLDRPEPGKVLTLTGPTPGVGKTTLSMALAMSFARTGTRTLLIDLDLIGRGVTERCGLQDVAEGDGVLAALAGQPIDRCFHPSLVRHLWVMPASRDGERRVADLSRKHVHRLIRAAREHFEMVIVDTGPLLGSLECSLVLPESDDVLLVVSRGDAGAVVRQAVDRLATERVRLAGLIFNRAAPKDCERFSSSLTSRTSGPSRPVHLTAPVGVLAATRQYGPVAYATASCLSRDN